MSKMRLSATLMMILYLTSTAAIAIQVNADPTTLYVDDDGGTPYTTIQAAVDASSDGDTIYVYAGVYGESVSVVGFTSLTIKAEGAGHDEKSVLINPTPSGFTNGFTVYSDGVTIEGFEIDGCNFGIWFEGSYNKFSNNYIHDIASTNVWDDGGVGISLWDYDGGSDYNEITKNRIEDIERTGILLDVAWTSYIVTGNSIVKNDIKNTPWGSIEVLNAEYTTIHHNILSDCGDWGIALLAVYGIESNYNIIHHNKVMGSTSWAGIMVYPFYGGVASHNKIHHNTANTYWDLGSQNRDFKNSWN